MSRTKNSIKNSYISLIFQGIGLFINFIVRIFFIKYLGNEYLGINGLMTNLLNVLSLAELGVGEAINFSLYEPLAKNNKEKVKSLMQLYKKIYIFIGGFITVIGLLLIPFLNYIINDYDSINNVVLIFILFLLNTSSSYLFSYKRNLLIADQKTYIVTIIKYVIYIIFKIIQIIYLIVFSDYIGYLIIQVIETVLEYLASSLEANKLYPYLQEKNIKKLDKETKKDILKNTKAMMMHKVGDILVNSTDNILLTKIVSLTAVGLYSNYYMITSALTMIFGQVFSSLTSSIGNLCTEKNYKKNLNIFKSLDLITFWIYGFCSVCLFILLNPFIELWIGKQYLFSTSIIIVIILNFYISGMRKSVLTFREASGLFYKDRWKALVQALVNLVASIILGIKFGTIGIFLGTIISLVSTCLTVEPYILYKYCFKENVFKYYVTYIGRFLILVITTVLIYSITKIINYNLIFNLIIKFIICCILCNCLFYLFFHKTKEYKYIDEKFISKVMNKIKNKVRKVNAN